jgi:hypothetical protein
VKATLFDASPRLEQRNPIVSVAPTAMGRR